MKDQQLQILFSDYVKNNATALNNLLLQQAFADALAFFQLKTGGYFNLAALSSEDEKTQDAQTGNKSTLFFYIKESIQNDTFYLEKANAIWQQAQHKYDPNKLREYHGDPENLGIKEKFLKNYRLIAEAWLTDLDLSRLRAQCGISDQVEIIPFDQANVAQILKFAKASKVSESGVCSIGLLLNSGERYDLKSQGVHWSSAVIKVDANNKKITVAYMDSANLSEKKQQEITNKLTQAVRAAGFVEGDYPDISVEHKEVTKQKDAWSCGYRAFSNILTELGVDNATANKIKSSKDGAKNLSKAVFECLLSDKETQKQFFENEKNAGRGFLGSEEETLKSAIVFAVNNKSRSRQRDSLIVWQTEKQCQKTINENKGWFKSQAGNCIVDLNQFDEKDLANSTFYLALFKTINAKLDDKVTSLEFVFDNEKVNKIPFIEALSLLYWSNNNLTLTLPEHTDEKIRACFNEIEARNKLIHFLDIKIDLDIDIWEQVWQARRKDPNLTQDVKARMGQLRFISRDNDTITEYSINAGSAYIDSLFRDLEDNKMLWQGGGEIRYSTLAVGFADEEHGMQTEAYIDQLLAYLKSRKYFPFTEIDLTIPDICFNSTGSNWLDKVIELVRQANKTPGLNKLNINLPVSVREQRDFTKDQYKKLFDLYMGDENLTLDLAITLIERAHDVIQSEYREKFYALLAQRVHDKAVARNKLKIDKPAVKLRQQNGLMRHIKCQRGSVRDHLEIEVSALQQVESQLQTESEVEQEVEQEVEFEQQAETDFESNELVEHGIDEIVTRDDFCKVTYSIHIYNRCTQLGDKKLIDKIVDDCNLNPGLLWSAAISQLGDDEKLTKAPCVITKGTQATINYYPNLFLEGFAYHDMPHGFYLSQRKAEGQDQQTAICFDGARLVPNQNKSPLTLRIVNTEKNKELTWRGSLATIFKGYGLDNFTKNDVKTFFGMMEEGRVNTKNMTEEVFYKLLFLDDKTKKDEFQNKYEGLFKGDQSIFMAREEFVRCAELKQGKLTDEAFKATLDENFANKKAAQWSALADVRCQLNVEQLEQFLDALLVLKQSDPVMFLHFKENFIANEVSVLHLVNNKNIKLIYDMANWNYTKKKWWRHLVSQHVSATNSGDLTQLSQALDYFFRQAEDKISLPEECPIKETNNMFVSLSKLLYVLSKVRTHVKDQVQYLNDLNLDKEGVYYAAFFDNFRFFHPDMKLTPAELQRHHKFSCTLEELEAAVNNAGLDFAAVKTLFHRYLGSSDVKLAKQYRCYVELANQIEANGINKKILPLLAIVSTGERGAKALTLDVVQTAVASISKYQNQQVMTKLTNILNDLKTLPTLQETSGLLQFLSGLVEVEQNTFLESFERYQSIGFFSAFSVWQANPYRINSKNTFTIFNQLDAQLKNENDAGKITKLLAGLSGKEKKKVTFEDEQDDEQVLDDAEVKRFNDQLVVLNNNNSELFQMLLDIFSSVDVKNTKPKHLVTIKQFNNFITDHVIPDVKLSYSDVLNKVSTTFPQLKLKLSADEVSPLVFDDAIKELVALVNEKAGLPEDQRWKLSEFNSDNPAPVLVSKLQELDKKLNNEMGFAYQAFKPLIITKVQTALVSTVLKDSRNLVCKNKEKLPLNVLQKTLFNVPKIDSDFAKLGEGLTTLQNYNSEFSELASLLLDFKKKWGAAFKLDFLSCSKMGLRFNLQQTKDLLDKVDKLNFSFCPNTLLSAIWHDAVFAKEFDFDRYLEQIKKILSIDNFILNEKNKAEFISQCAKPVSLAGMNKFITLVEEQRDFSQVILSIYLHLIDSKNNYAADRVGLILAAVTKILEYKAVEKDVIKILLSKLKNKPERIQLLSDALENQVRVHDILKIFVYAASNSGNKDNSDAAFEAAFYIIKNLVKLVEAEPQAFDLLLSLFNQRPYPTLERCKEFLGSKEQEEFVTNYELDPPGKRKELEKFNEHDALKKIDSIIDLKRLPDKSSEETEPTQHKIAGLFYTHRRELASMLAYVTAKQEDFAKLNRKDFDEKRADLVKNLRNPECQDLQKLKLEFIALSCEALYRTTGMYPRYTQLLSVLLNVMYDGNIMSEIRTGEGKGIITALTAVTQWAQTGAVNVCSANMALAGRDQEEFCGFFSYLNIESSLISAQSKHASFQQQGINYSDMPNLALFQQRCEIEGKALPDKVDLILDEIDAIILDDVTQYKYATVLDPASDPHQNPFEAFYSVILAFIEKTDFITNDHDQAQDIDDLLTFLEDSDNWQNYLAPEFKSQHQEYKNLFFKNCANKRAQLNTWIDSAYIALQLKEREDFVIRDAILKRDKQEIPVKRAIIKINHREATGSTFSNGVQQFLHARLNRGLNDDVAIRYPIEPEKVYLSSKSGKNMLDYYTRAERGRIIGMTGTIGDGLEQLESRENYGFKFFKIPPHQILRRQHHADILARRKWFKRETAEDAHFREILAAVNNARKKNQPILLMCAGVDETVALHQYLQKHIEADSLQLYNGEQDKDTLNDTIAAERAGKPGRVTISTPMFGRGTDIKKFKDAPKDSKHRLFVIDTFIQPGRDYGQIIGRAGRNGDEGDDLLILSEEEFSKRNLALPRNAQELSDKIKQVQALISKPVLTKRNQRQLFADIKNQFQDRFVGLLDTVRQQFSQDEDGWKQVRFNLQSTWQAEFLTKLDKSWKTGLTALHNDKTKSVTNSNDLNELVKKVADEGNDLWKTFTESVAAMEHVQLSEEQKQNNGIKPKLEKHSYYGIDTRCDLHAKPLSVDAVSRERARLKYDANSSNKVALESNVVWQSLYSANKKLNLKLASASYKNLFLPRVSMQTVLSGTLKKYRHTFVDPYDGVSRGKILQSYQSLVKDIAKYGSSFDKEDIVNVFQSELESLRKNKESWRGDYTQAILKLISELRVESVITGQQFSELVGATLPQDQTPFDVLSKYALSQLNAYKNKWFVANDRKKAVNDAIKKLNCASAENKNVGFVLETLELLAKSAISTDEKWSWTTRNTNGSRLQVTVNQIRSLALGLQDKESIADNRVTALSAKLTRLNNLNPTGMRLDMHVLNELKQELINFDKLPSDEAERSRDLFEKLTLIVDRLAFYQLELLRSVAISGNRLASAQSVLLNFIAETLTHAQSLQRAYQQQLQQQLLNENTQDPDVKLVHQIKQATYDCRSAIQRSLHSLFVKRPTKYQTVDLLQQREIAMPEIDGGEDFDFRGLKKDDLQRICHEVARHIHVALPSENKPVLTYQLLEPGVNVPVVLQINAKFAVKDTQFNASFKLDLPKNDLSQSFCRVASIESESLSAPAAEAQSTRDDVRPSSPPPAENQKPGGASVLLQQGFFKVKFESADDGELAQAAAAAAA